MGLWDAPSARYCLFCYCTFAGIGVVLGMCIGGVVVYF